MSNHLAGATSPYLLAHAANPVEWYPWGNEALARARREDKPIFLSIGYAACHWCHVMAHESFEDPEIAAFMNDYFVSIKVDREERPDLDTIYMDAVVAMTGGGGWPLSAFLTPEGDPFFGGTYFPPTPRGRMPSFRQVLEGVAELWASDRARAQSAGSELRVRLAGDALGFQAGSAELDGSVEGLAAERLFATYDWANGGWGGAPKFPQAMAVEFLLFKAVLTSDPLARDMATHGLGKMADGGIFDHLGGGFARYSVDSHWEIPHFEKMLYDNALLAGTYLHAWQATRQDRLLRVHRSILTFLLEEMRSSAGGFYASIDADSEGEEGRFYTWERQTIQSELESQDNYDLFAVAFGLDGDPNFDGKYVLHRAVGDRQLADRFGLTETQVAEGLDESRHRLLEIRQQRIRPAVDDKVIAAWNGYVLRTLAQSARALDDQTCLAAALSLADFLQTQMWHEGRLLRSWRQGQVSQEGYLEDYAALGLGCLSLYESTFDSRWYEFALQLAHAILDRFSDSHGGFFDTSEDNAGLIIRPKSHQDSPTPSGGAQAAELLLRLSSLSNDQEGFFEPAARTLAAMQSLMVQHPGSYAAWLCDLSLAVRSACQLAILGPIDAKGFGELRAVADQPYLPTLALAGGSTGEGKIHPPLLDDRQAVGGLPTAYLCRDFVCLKPTSDPAELEVQLRAAL